jgi:hypothetical protein
LYEAANSIEAHMLAELLKQEGLAAHIQGAHLQGAIGELPAAGLVRLVIAPEQYLAARAVIERWEATQPLVEPAKSPPSRFARAKVFVAGLVLGVGMAYVFFHVPVSSQGIDYDHDGVLDERWSFAPSGQPMKVETDRNLDRKIDYVAQYDKRGQIESATADDNFDGVFETRLRFRNGNVEMSESDYDGNGVPETRSNYVAGLLDNVETIEATRGTAFRVEHFKNGQRVHDDIDTDNDGHLDTRITYTPRGDVATKQELRREGK